MKLIPKKGIEVLKPPSVHEYKTTKVVVMNGNNHNATAANQNDWQYESNN